MNRHLLIARNGSRDCRKVALTFDDGPNPHATPQILDILKQHRCDASFFVIGDWALEHPELVKRMTKEGHCVGGHTFSHDYGQTNGSRPFFDFKKGNRILEYILGKEAQVIRVPGFGYARTNTDGSFRIEELLTGDLQRQISKRQISVVDHDVESNDWRGIPANKIINNVVPKVKNGSIILFHDGSEKESELPVRPLQLLKALPEIIRALKERGFEFVKLDDLTLEYQLKSL